MGSIGTTRSGWGTLDSTETLAPPAATSSARVVVHPDSAFFQAQVLTGAELVPYAGWTALTLQLRPGASL